MSAIFEAMETYRIRWDSQSRNAGESMPLGGHDIGCNVWAEGDAVLLYMAQSGAFDEAGRMDKAGRLRLTLTPGPFEQGFAQELDLWNGCVEISGRSPGGRTHIGLWVDVFRPALHIDVVSDREVSVCCGYETWRGEGSGVPNFDRVEPAGDRIVFYHRNRHSPVFDARIAEQGLSDISGFFPNVEKNRTFGGAIVGEGMEYAGTGAGSYAGTPFTSYTLRTRRPGRRLHIVVWLHTAQTPTLARWKEELAARMAGSGKGDEGRRAATRGWWHAFWGKSHVSVWPGRPDTGNPDWQAGRNYQLFRYMLGCNAMGEYPTKFNGGLFTVDPAFCGTALGSLLPDDRDWGGLIFTAQNQRLVYWPMIKNGDFDLMRPQFEFYRRILPGVQKRTEHFFRLTDCACFPEQLDANGLSAFYGGYGLDYPLQVRYHHVEALEFAYMMLRYAAVSGRDISEYMDFIAAVLQYYERAYRRTDAAGKRILFPSTALETYHAAANPKRWKEEADYDPAHVAVANPADLIAALHATIRELLAAGYGTGRQRAQWRELDDGLPPVPRERKRGHEVIAPCAWPAWYVKINCEFPQMNTVYPYGVYGIGRPELQLAQDTYDYGWDDRDQLDYVSWHQAGIFAARLGRAGEAQRYMRRKLADSGRRFPAFWGPGHDYVPDHNWGGSGMVGMQEMLLQTCGKTIYLLPAWPLDVGVDFKLWTDALTCVEADYRDGTLRFSVTPPGRRGDVVIPPGVRAEARDGC